MPKASVLARARRDAAAGQPPSTQAGEFVREEMHRLHAGTSSHVQSARQAIAVGLSEARRAGVKVAAPRRKN